MDAIDRGILNILSLYENLSFLELWFEIGETGGLGPVTKGEVLSRLQSLMAQGFLEGITVENGDVRWKLKRS